jgi:4-hydroxy-2-oxoheptanedioate aldolase
MSGYLAEADAQICLLVQVETRKGLENLQEIAGTEGVDGVFIGPSDLSADLGFRGQPGAPEVQAAIADALKTILTAGKAPGILTTDAAQAHRYIEQGFLFVAVGTDVGLLVQASSGLAQSFSDKA